MDGCGLVFAAEPAVLGVCADCGRLSPPPGKYQCLCVSCQASGPLCPWEQPGGRPVGAQPQQSHPQCPSLWTQCVFFKITVQLSPLVFDFLVAMIDQGESVIIYCGDLPKDWGDTSGVGFVREKFSSFSVFSFIVLEPL